MVSGHTGNVAASLQEHSENATGAENAQRTIPAAPISDARLAAIQSQWEALTEPIRAAMFALLEAAIASNK